MNHAPDDIAEQQAEITRVLLHYLNGPLPSGHYIRGILPSPTADQSIRLVTGPRHSAGRDELTVWEIPLAPPDSPEDLLDGEEILQVLRSLHTGTQIFASDRISTLMGMEHVAVDLTAVDTPSAGPDDNAFTILRTLTCPWTEDEPSTRLRGFLYAGHDGLRLYLDQAQDRAVVAVDVRPSGAITALLTALPSLISEEGRGGYDPDDPHCARAVDLRNW